MRIAVFPGTFDPITNGHIDIVKRALPLFDRIIVAIGVNSKKTTLYSLSKRIQWLEEVFKGEEKISIDYFEGLTVNFCMLHGAKYLVRGLRNAADFDYEKTISQVNSAISDQIETVFLISRPEFSHISSTIVREVITGKADVHVFVPDFIADEIAIGYK